MREIRIKQKKLYKAMRILLYAAIAVLVVYIGAEPMVAKASHVAALVMNYVCDALVIASMFMLLMYYSKYGKVDGYLSRIEDELADAGYYLSDRPEREIQPLTAAVLADLDRYGYTVERDLELSEMPFDARAMKKKEFFFLHGSSVEGHLAEFQISLNGVAVPIQVCQHRCGQRLDLPLRSIGQIIPGVCQFVLNAAEIPVHFTVLGVVHQKHEHRGDHQRVAHIIHHQCSHVTGLCYHRLRTDIHHQHCNSCVQQNAHGFI